MSFIEVFDPKERSFYRAELLDIKGDFAKIVFEGTERKFATYVPTRFIRPEPDPTPCGYTPQLHDCVEVLFCLLQQAPSYWEGTVRNIMDGVALVEFPDPNYNDVYEFTLLRPAAGLDHASVFELFTVPRDFFHDDFVELNKAAIDCIRKTSGLTSLRFMPTHQALALHGCSRSVSEAKSLLSAAFDVAAAAAAAVPDISASFSTLNAAQCSGSPIAPRFCFQKTTLVQNVRPVLAL